MFFTRLLLENTLAVRPYNCEAASELHLLKVARCIPVLSSRFIEKCATRVLMRSTWYTALHKIHLIWYLCTLSCDKTDLFGDILPHCKWLNTRDSLVLIWSIHPVEFLVKPKRNLFLCQTFFQNGVSYSKYWTFFVFSKDWMNRSYKYRAISGIQNVAAKKPIWLLCQNTLPNITWMLMTYHCSLWQDAASWWGQYYDILLFEHNCDVKTMIYLSFEYSWETVFYNIFTLKVIIDTNYTPTESSSEQTNVS